MKKKFFVIASGIVLILIALFVGGKVYVFHKIAQEINVQADSLRAKGFSVTFDSLQSSAMTNDVSVRNVNITFPKNKCADSASQFTARRLEINGIKLFPALLKRHLNIGGIVVDHGFFRDAGFPENSKKSDKATSAKEKLIEFNISTLKLNSMRFERVDTGSCRVSQRGEITLKIDNLTIHHPVTRQRSIDIDRLKIDDATLSLPLKFYTITMHEFVYGNNEASAKIDSLIITPWYDKIAFAQKTGVQTDRIDMKISTIEISGLKRLIADTLRIERIAISFKADIFHDKRQPGGKPKIKKLISRMIHDVKYPFQIDSIIVRNTSVRYEEFPKEGSRSGHVLFDKLNASLGNLSTFSPHPMTMNAHARFMDAGNLSAFFTFPSNPDKAYTIKGSLTNFPLPAINAMLIPAANAEIKKGHLRSMLFNMEYNDLRSDGQLIMNYDDLEMISLLKSSKNKREENKFLTLILKSFVVKKDMDAAKNTGTILFYRDQDKASFNFWWKSLLSGIKSVFNLDKIVDTHHPKKKS